MDKLKIEFIASLPDILSAINIAGQDGNSRMKLDIPASEIEAVIKMIGLKGKAFKVTIEEIEEEINNGYKNSEIDNLDLIK